mgnify:CR=1 FL=1
MVMYRTALALTLLLLSGAAAGQTIIESVAAKVNQTVITYSEILQEGALLNIENGLPMQTPLSKELREKILDTLIVRTILSLEARERSLPVNEQAVTEMLATYEKLPFLSEFLTAFELTPLEFRMIVKKRLVVRLMTDEFLKRKFKTGDVRPEEERNKAVEEWFTTLRKKHRIINYTLP